MKKWIIIVIICALAGGTYFWKNHRLKANNSQADSSQTTVEAPAVPEKTDRIERIAIAEGAVFGELMATSGMPYAQAMEIYEAAKPVYDLAKVRVGREIELVYDKDDEGLKELKYKVDTESELHVRNLKYGSSTEENRRSTSAPDVERQVRDQWQAKLEPIPYEVKQKTAGANIQTSMYQAAIDNNIDIAAIIELASAFEYTIDFALDPRVGDDFKFIYDERYLDGKYIMPGQIYAGRYTNEGKEHYVYYFEEDKDNKGFYDQDGNAVQKMFLRAPVSFRYISSGFTTGLRYIEAFNVSTGHRAVDYAAAAGTPIRAVGDGTVTFAGWSSAGYGRLTTIRHSGTYSTNYGHQSKIIVKKGQKVSQGQIIGYVGSTGFSTGPHLHYEMVKNGVKVNPLKEVQPPGKPIRKENMARFKELAEKYKEMLK